MSDTLDNSQNNYQLAHEPDGKSKFMIKIMGASNPKGGEIFDGVTSILNSYSSAFLIPAGGDTQEYYLIDSGADAKATAILAHLEHLGVDASAVKAIFVTHGHPDHTAGLRQFKSADVYVGAGDKAYIEGKARSQGKMAQLSGPRPDLAVEDPAKIHIIDDGQTVTVGNQQIRAISLPGHTDGSMAYLTNGYLYVGDAVFFNKHEKAVPPPWVASTDTKQALNSLKHLLQLLDDEKITVKAVIPNHSAPGTIDAIREVLKDK